MVELVARRVRAKRMAALDGAAEGSLTTETITHPSETDGDIS
jgi:hypothetical protein